MEMLSFTEKFVGRALVGCFNYDFELLWRGGYFLQLCHLGWMSNFTFCIHITEHMNEIEVKCENRIVNKISDKITTFERNLQFCEQQMWSNNDTLPNFEIGNAYVS
jgi:hypothetical protein